MNGQSDNKDDLPVRVAERFLELLEGADEVPGHVPAALRTLLAEGGVNADKVLDALREVEGDPAP